MALFYLQFFELLNIAARSRLHVWIPEEILSLKYVICMQKCQFQNLALFWPDLELKSDKSQIEWLHRAKLWSISTLKVIHETYVERCTYFWLLFLVTFCGLILMLTLLSTIFVLLQYISLAYAGNLDELEPCTVSRTVAMTRKVKCFILTFDLTST